MHADGYIRRYETHTTHTSWSPLFSLTLSRSISLLAAALRSVFGMPGMAQRIWTTHTPAAQPGLRTRRCSARSVSASGGAARQCVAERKRERQRERGESRGGAETHELYIYMNEQALLCTRRVRFNRPLPTVFFRNCT